MLDQRRGFVCGAGAEYDTAAGGNALGPRLAGVDDVQRRASPEPHTPSNPGPRVGHLVARRPRMPQQRQVHLGFVRTKAEFLQSLFNIQAVSPLAHSNYRGSYYTNKRKRLRQALNGGPPQLERIGSRACCEPWARDCSVCNPPARNAIPLALDVCAAIRRRPVPFQPCRSPPQPPGSAPPQPWVPQDSVLPD